MGVSNINYIELKNCIVDEIHLRENVYNINLSSDGVILKPTPLSKQRARIASYRLVPRSI